MKFTEYQLEKAFIELLQSEDIPHVNGATISRDIQEVLIEEDLKTFLLSKYKNEKLTDVEVERIVRQLKTYSASDLYESNKSIMKLVADGFSFKREDRSQKIFGFI
jgi:type I restriction enzyme R subunit